MAEKLKIGREYVVKFIGKERLTSVDFVDTFRAFDKDNSGYIENEELDEFLSEIIRKANVDSGEGCYTSPDIQKLKQDILEHADLNKDGKIDISELAIILPKDENFLLTFKAKQAKKKRISSVDFMQIWRYYDQDGNGTLDAKELRGFFYDLLTKINKRVKSPKEMQDDVEDLVQATKIVCRKSGRVELHHLKSLLPVEKNFLEKFPRFREMTKKEFDRVFNYYDGDQSGEIEGEELLAFLKDIIERRGLKPTMADIEELKITVMERVDADNDGKISKKELTSYFVVPAQEEQDSDSI